MSQQGDLLARVLADPDDRATRLVYADAISATDPARGELIVVEDQLADTPRDSRVLRARRAALLRANAARWWRRHDARTLTTRGGFVRGLHLDGLLDAEGAALLVAAEPVTTLVITGEPDPPRTDVFARIRDVDIHGNLDPRLLGEWFAALPPMLDSLQIAHAFNGDCDPIAFAAGMPDARCLGFDRFGDSVEMMLDVFTGWSTLEELAVHTSVLRADIVLHLARRDLAHLHTLRLRGSIGTVAELEALARIVERMPAPATLDLTAVHVSENRAATLTALVGDLVGVRRRRPAPTAAFTLHNHYIEIRPADGGKLHRIAIDGTDVPFQFRKTVSGQAAGLGETPDLVAPLTPLVHALSIGTPFDWHADYFGFRANAWLRASDELSFHFQLEDDLLTVHEWWSRR